MENIKDDQSNVLAVDFQHVSKSFNKAEILKDIHFQIPQGKIVTILGFSGAGKSTLLKHILGLMKPTTGSISVLGKNLAELDDFEKREFRKNFGMLFQYAALFDSFSVLENVIFPLKEFSPKTKKEMIDYASDLLESVGIAKDAFGRLPSEISGGMRKRVGLARALALKPKILLYDEPTTGLDPITTKMVNDLISETAHSQKEMTSIIISHDVQATLKISDLVAFLDRGRIVEYLPADDFKKSEHPLVREFLSLV
jgi:phospholipid/cholesterol/gamma-HCH transport system ATP-binding protein